MHPLPHPPKISHSAFLIFTVTIAMFLVMSPIVFNVPTRGLLAVETMHANCSVAGKFEYQKKHDVNVCKQEISL